jgi:hypothetical protein
VDRKDIDDDLKVEMMLEPWGDGFEPLSLSLYYYHAGRKSVDRKDIDDDLKVEMMLEPWGMVLSLSLSLSLYYHAGRTVWRVQGKPKPKRSKKLEKKATSEFFL